MAKTTPEQQAWFDGFEVGSEHATTAFAKGNHMVYALRRPRQRAAQERSRDV